jgi:hypothetical protein
MDQSNREVRDALAAIVERFGAWRAEVAMLSARAARGEPAHADEMRLHCDAILVAIRAAHEELVLDFAEAPAAISGHSRVADVEKALDQLEVELNRLKARLLS